MFFSIKGSHKFSLNTVKTDCCNLEIYYPLFVQEISLKAKYKESLPVGQD